jgi:hypothetical protein
MPFGRIRTTMITATSRPIWPNSCPCQDVIADFTTEKYVGAADHHRDEGFHDKGGAHGRHQRHGGRVQAAGEAGEPGAAGKGETVDQARIDAERRGHVRHLDRGACEDAETGPIEQHVETAKNSQRGCEQHEAVNGIGVLADLKAAERRADTCHRGAHHDQRALGRNQAQAPGRHDRVKRPVVEVPDHRDLNQRADQRGDDGAGHDRERKRQAGMGRRCRHIGSAHDEFAVGEIDHAHHAKDHREPTCRQHKERECVAELIERGECEGRDVHELTGMMQIRNAMPCHRKLQWFKTAAPACRSIRRGRRQVRVSAAGSTACTAPSDPSWSGRSPLRRASTA